MVNSQKKTTAGEERRRTKRIMVSDAFSFFVVIPKKLGMVRVYMKDISAGGLSFWTDLMDPFTKDSEFQIRVYTGPTMYLPLTVKVIRVAAGEVAVEYTQAEEKSVAALEKFLDFLELATEAAIVENPAS